MCDQKAFCGRSVALHDTDGVWRAGEVSKQGMLRSLMPNDATASKPSGNSVLQHATSVDKFEAQDHAVGGVPPRKVHVFDYQALLPMNSIFDLGELGKRNIDVSLGVQLLRNQFTSALHLWESPSHESIWGDSEHRVTIHLRRGDVKNTQKHITDFSEPVALSSQKAATGLSTYLESLGATTGTRIVVSVLAETSDTDPELKPLRDIESSLQGLHVKFYLGEAETTHERAQARTARDLFIMGSSTVLFMSSSSFSLLGACLQEPTAIRYAEEQTDEADSEREEVSQGLGWDLRIIKQLFDIRKF